MQHIYLMIRRHWKPLLAVNALVFGAAAFNVITLEKTWKADAKMILPNPTSDLNLNLGTLGNISEGEGLIFSQQIDSRQILVSIMTSDDAVRYAWEFDPEREQYGRLDVYKGLFNVDAQDASTIISVEAEGSSPEIAEERLKLFIDAFQTRLDELRLDDAGRRAQYIERELADVKLSLEQASRELINFQEQTSLVNPQVQSAELVSAIKNLSLIQTEIASQLNGSQAKVTTLTDRLQQTPEQAVVALQLAEETGYQELRARLATLATELAEARSLFTDNNPQVQQLLAEQEDLLSRQRDYVERLAGGTVGFRETTGENYANLIEQLVLAETDVLVLQSQNSTLQSQLQKLNDQLEKLPQSQADFEKLQREYNVVEGVYNGLVAKLGAVRVNAFDTYPVIRTLDQPAPRAKPTGPGRKPIAVGAILAAAFGSAAIVLFLESRNPLLSSDDLRKRDLPFLGRIPAFSQLQHGIDYRLESDLSFQNIAVALSKMPLPDNRIVVTSAASEEGKTTVALGIAIALSQMGLSVLLVDANPSNTKFPIWGWTRDIPPLKTIGSVPLMCVRDKLDILCAPKNTVEYEWHISQVLCQDAKTHEIANRYDYTLIDCAHVGSSRITNQIFASFPHTLMVVRPGLSCRKPFNDALDQLNRSQSVLLGIVMNAIGAEMSAHVEAPKKRSLTP
jgi:succinoglycan biosynthesis transport protein ExoP